MDMKKILQAMDGISTKPVEGADSMAKFLRVVKEAEVNPAAVQPVDEPTKPYVSPNIKPYVYAQEPDDPNYAKYVELMTKYEMLDDEITGKANLIKIHTGASDESLKEMQRMKAFAQQLAGPNLQAWEQIRIGHKTDPAYIKYAQDIAAELAAKYLEENTKINNISSFLQIVREADLNPTAPAAPLAPDQIAYNQLRAQLDGLDAIRGDATTNANTFTNISPEVTASVDAMRQQLAQMAAALKAKGIDAAAEYDAPEPGDVPAAPMDLQQRYASDVQENSLSKFLSIVNKNNVSMLKEGANPHKVALPVQMAMQHYQHTAETKQPRERLIDKYFVEAEADIIQQREEKRSLINQYAKTIAERVLMKESKLDEKSVSPKQARTMAAAAHDPEFAKRVGIKQSVAKEFNKADTGTKQLSQAMKAKKKVNEAPIAMDPSEPNNPTVHGHDKANSMSLKGRIMSARAQLKELAQLAESDNLLVWEEICKKAKGGMFMGLEQNLEQIRHGISELAAKRRKGGVSSKGIDKHIGEGSKK